MPLLELLASLESVPNLMEQALAKCLGGGGEGGGFARCLPPVYGYLRVRITRCANLFPVGDDTYGDAPSVCCACWIAGSPEVQQTTPREKRDLIGSVLDGGGAHA